MLTFMLIGAGLIIVVVAILAYSSRSNKKAAEKSPRIPGSVAASVDVSSDADRRRATGAGDD